MTLSNPVTLHPYRHEAQREEWEARSLERRARRGRVATGAMAEWVLCFGWAGSDYVELFFRCVIRKPSERTHFCFDYNGVDCVL